jgi:uncharacterized protein (TIGR03083 family)
VTREKVYQASIQQRLAVADLIDGLDEDQLTRPSLCRGWDLRTVAAHLASAVSPGKLPFLLAVLRHRGDAHRANDTMARRTALQPTADLAATLRRYAESRFAPPVVGPCGPLTDVVVHGGDMRLPLGLTHTPDPSHVRLALEFITTGRPVGFMPKRRLDHLRLVAEDTDWAWGDGDVISGSGIDLLMAACGRTAVLERLSGPAVPVLRDRLPEV